MILNPRAKKKRLQAGEDRPIDVEAAPSSSPRQSQETVQIPNGANGVSYKEKDSHTQSQAYNRHHNLIPDRVSKEEGEMDYTIDPIGAAIRSAGTHETTESRTG
jgi:hypothetical protein